MKSILKKIIYSIIIGTICIIFSINLFSNVIIDELKEYSEVYIDRNHLYDTAIVCTQLYFINPNEINKLTCTKITKRIKELNEKLDKYYFANIYLTTINRLE